MACCALAVFVLCQIYALVDLVRRGLGLSDRSVEIHDGAAAWRLGADNPVLAVRRWTAARFIFLGSFGALALSAASLTIFAPSKAEAAMTIVHNTASWCGEKIKP